MPCSWLLKRIGRYSYISWKHYTTRDRLTLEPLTSALPPHLPSLLAACAPSTKLSLDVQEIEGKSAQANDVIAHHDCKKVALCLC